MDVRTVDYHTAGEPFRIVVGGVGEITGANVLERRETAAATERIDRLRRLLCHEPRGHADMYGALLTEPERHDSDAGVLFMHNEGFSTMCGHGIIAVVTIAIERGLITPKHSLALTLDAPAGQIRARADVTTVDGRTRVERVSFVNVPSFVLAAALPVEVNGRRASVDVAFGGAFYAIVDSESVGLPIDAAHVPDLRRIGMEIKHAVEAQQSIAHPLEPGLRGIYGTIFTGPPRDERADLRNVTSFADAEVDRSPCGTGTAAVMAVVDAMGLLAEDRPFEHESLIGTRFAGRVRTRTLVGEHHAIVPEIEGSAWITGEHTFLIHDDDPLKDGFRI